MKKSIFNFSILLLIMLLFVIGFSYAYFTQVIDGSETTATIEGEAGVMKITYENNSGYISSSGFLPSNTEPALEKSFSIKGINTTNTNTLTYRLLLTIDNSFFTFPFKYTLEHNGQTVGGMIDPVSFADSSSVTYGTYVLGLGHFNKTPSDGIVHSYILKLFYPEAGADQSIDKGKEIVAHVEIDDSLSVLPEIAQLVAAPNMDNVLVNALWEGKTANLSGLFINSFAFWQDNYFPGIKNIIFENKIDVPSSISDSRVWDVGVSGNGNIMAYLEETPENDNCNFGTNSYTCYNLHIQSNTQIYANENMGSWFAFMVNLGSIQNLDLVNFVTTNNMSSMFFSTGNINPSFSLNLGDKFDTSNVTNMSWMFANTAYLNPSFTLDLGDRFDTSRVEDMSYMFVNIAHASTVFKLDLKDKFDTSNVTNMMFMFYNVARESTVFTLDLGEMFDTSNVTNMTNMFGSLAYSCPSFTLDLGYKFNTSKVEKMPWMFYNTAHASTVFTLDLGKRFNTSNVDDMQYMFGYTAQSSTVFTLNLGDKFNTSNVTNMEGMFFSTGISSNIFRVNASNWNVSKVTNHLSFNAGVTSKVVPPTWIN